MASAEYHPRPYPHVVLDSQETVDKLTALLPEPKDKPVERLGEVANFTGMPIYIGKCGYRDCNAIEAKAIEI